MLQLAPSKITFDQAMWFIPNLSPTTLFIFCINHQTFQFINFIDCKFKSFILKSNFLILTSLSSFFIAGVHICSLEGDFLFNLGSLFLVTVEQIVCNSGTLISFEEIKSSNDL